MQILPSPSPCATKQSAGNQLLTVSRGWVRLAPLIGTALAHNWVQGVLMNQPVSYLSAPLPNFFVNLPISVITGSVFAATLKTFLPKGEVAPTSYELTSKSIAWAAFFNTANAMSMLLPAAKVIPLGPIATTVGLVLASGGLSLGMLHIAEHLLITGQPPVGDEWA